MSRLLRVLIGVILALARSIQPVCSARAGLTRRGVGSSSRFAAGIVSMLVGVSAFAAYPTTAHVSTTTAGPAIFTYDTPTIARVGAHQFMAAEAGGTRLGTEREGSASPAVEGRSTSTTPRTVVVATNTVRTSDLVDGPLWTSTKKSSSAQNALRHFNDHGADFPDVQNAMEYAAKAQDFLRTPPGGTLSRVRSNGDVVRYHPGSNTFGVMDANSAPRTLFRPDPAIHGHATNMDYFYAQ